MRGRMRPHLIKGLVAVEDILEYYDSTVKMLSTEFKRERDYSEPVFSLFEYRCKSNAMWE
jgi:hypothetical protein